jgi:hypothetical protein
MKDSLKTNTAKDGLKTKPNIKPNDAYSWWMWLSLVQFIVILYLLFKGKPVKKLTEKEQLKKQVLDQKVDFDNLINSSFSSKEIYNQLKLKCHPDKFVMDSEKNKIALDIFQEISKNKTNTLRLNELKKEAEEKLNIKF